ncbi:MAG: hypothetical protein LBJ65_20235 [Burkholderia sp.]|uniref:hypothetical protein n=1 Tax=Burkholderia sp. TaxID=36773 RepID=UPI002839837B|nr:hypothetical protein [Burkholderia sp.]MDR0243930.1 hypothetical protein [Burkholderia sp.]
MRVLPNRNVRARDGWRAVLNSRAESRHAASCRCRECGFVARSALERCPVCGQWDWPFDPIRHTRDPAHATAPRAVRSWSSHVAHTLRNAALRRPSASSAPILSLLTLVLLVGGYVMVDRTCKADPVCRGSGTPASAATESGLHTVNEPVLPVLPTPVFPFHSPGGTPQLAAIPPHDDANASPPAGRMQVAQAAPSIRAPDRTRAGAVRVADWKGSRDAAHRTHPIRRVSLHARHRRYTASGNAEIARLYRGH